MVAHPSRWILLLAGASTAQSLFVKPAALVNSPKHLSMDDPALDPKAVADRETWDLDVLRTIADDTVQLAEDHHDAVDGTSTGTADSYCGTEGWVHWKQTFAGLAPHEVDANLKRAWEPLGNTTLLVEADISAFNNRRMSQETAVCLAFLTKRWYRAPMLTPKEYYLDSRLKFYNDEGEVRELHLFDYYDEASFRHIIPTMNSSEPLEPTQNIYYANKENILEGPAPVTKMNGAEHMHIVFKGGDAEVRLMHQYAAWDDFQPHKDYVQLIESAFRIRQDIICRAVMRLQSHGLQPFGYVALHMRLGDFLEHAYYKDKKDLVSSENVAKFVSEVVKGQTVLVITDQYDPQLLSDLRTIGGAKRVVCWANLNFTGEDDVYDAQIDMLSAVPASTFIASPFSTFSTGIVRWRVQAGTHKVGQPLHSVMPFNFTAPGDFTSPGAAGTWLMVSD
mmetsp:Transcript_111127/g.202022  ORF Transcript_111127/g.202022 Transcript_111127/m.202022 type:complete len:449 (-) Transcript_111127:50-1396(-)